MKPDRGHLSPARAPQALAVRERYERLGRRPVIVPVLFVRRADQVQVDVERRIPVGDVRGLGDAGVVGSQVAVVGRAGDRNDVRDAELRLVRGQPSLVLPDVVLQRERVAGGGIEIVRRPPVQDHRRRGGGLVPSARPHPGGARLTRRAGALPRRDLAYRVERARGDQRVRRQPVAYAERVGQVGQHGLGAQTERPGDELRRQGSLVVHQPRGRLDADHPVLGECPHAEAQVVEGRHRAQRRLGRRQACGGRSRSLRRSGGGSEQHRVDPAFLLQVPLQPRERHEDRARQPLLRPERELAQLLRRQDPLDAEPQGPADIVAPAVEGADRDLRRLLHPDQQGVAVHRAQLVRKPRADEDVVAPELSRRRVEAVEFPEAMVHPVDLDARRPAPARLMRDEAFDRDDRRRAAEGGRHPVGLQQFRRQLLPHEVEAGDHLVYRPQPFERQGPQAGPDRRADQERPGQDRHRHRDAADDGQIGGPEVDDVAPDECEQGHADTSYRCAAEPTRSRTAVAPSRCVAATATAAVRPLPAAGSPGDTAWDSAPPARRCASR